MPIQLVHAHDYPSLRKVVFHEGTVDQQPRVLQTLARHKTVSVTQYRMDIDHIPRPVGVPPIVIPPIDWAVPVSELTRMLSGVYPRVNSLGFGERGVPLLLKGTEEEFVALARALRAAFPVIYSLELYVRLRDNNGKPLSALPFFENAHIPYYFFFGLDTGTGMRAEPEILPLLLSGRVYRGKMLHLWNPLTVEQCLGLGRPVGDANNETLTTLALSFDVERDVEKEFADSNHKLNLDVKASAAEVTALKERMSRSIETGAVQSAKKVANLLFHFKFLETVHFNGANIGSSFVKALLTELLEILQHQQHVLQNREGLSGSKLVFKFADISEAKLSKDCQQSVLSFIDDWNRCPVYFHFLGVVDVGDPAFHPYVHPFDRAHKFKSTAKAAMLNLDLSDPNNQHFDKLIEAITTNLTRVKREQFSGCCEEDMIEVALMHELLSKYPIMIQPGPARVSENPPPPKKYKREEKCVCPEGFIPFGYY